MSQVPTPVVQVTNITTPIDKALNKLIIILVMEGKFDLQVPKASNDQFLRSEEPNLTSKSIRDKRNQYSHSPYSFYDNYDYSGF